MFSTNFSPLQLKSFQQNGFIILKNFCCRSEVDTLLRAARKEKASHARNEDSIGCPNSKQQLAQWFTPGNDVFGCLERSEKIVSTVSHLLGNSSPVCHVYSKLMEKEPKLGGVWAWHQDYAYWQGNKFLSGDKMLGVMVAITPISKENGCSQLIRGSHKLGKLPHNFNGPNLGACDISVQEALQSMEIVYPELEAGDALFFHSNLLHRADANLTSEATWSNISCYSLQENLAKRQIFSSWHTPVQVLKNEEILNRASRMLPGYAIGRAS